MAKVRSPRRSRASVWTTSALIRARGESVASRFAAPKVSPICSRALASLRNRWSRLIQTGPPDSSGLASAATSIALAPFAGLAQVDGGQIDERNAVRGIDLDDLAKRGLGLAKLAGLHEGKRAHVLHESRLRREDDRVALGLEGQQLRPKTSAARARPASRARAGSKASNGLPAPCGSRSLTISSARRANRSESRGISASWKDMRKLQRVTDRHAMLVGKQGIELLAQLCANLRREPMRGPKPCGDGSEYMGLGRVPQELGEPGRSGPRNAMRRVARSQRTAARQRGCKSRRA